MSVRFTIGHVGGGTKDVDLPPEEVDGVLVSFLEELYDADDEHYQGYVVNAADEAVTVFDGGLMVLDRLDDGRPEATRYFRPLTQAEAIGVLRDLVNLRREAVESLFGPDVPPPAPGLNYLLLGMGKFALHRAAWKCNLTQAKQLVEAGHDVNQQTPEGATPLMGAVTEGHVELCRFLIEHGANVNVRLPSDWESDNWSLLRLARKEGVPEVVRLLEQAGAAE